MRNGLRTVLLMGLASVATYVVAEWSVLQKSGVHDLREAAPVEVPAVPHEPERVALRTQVDQLEQTLGEYRAVQDRMIAECLERIARIEARVAQLAAQRVPVPAVATVPTASRPVRWAMVEQDGASEGIRQGAYSGLSQQDRDAAPSSLLQLAREVGFTKVEVRR